MWLKSPAWVVVPENLDRLIELLNLQWLLQNRDRADLKNPIEDLAVWVTCDHDDVEVWINLLAHGFRRQDRYTGHYSVPADIAA